VFRAEIDGKALTPDLAGLRGLNWVMKDRETGSLWQQGTGEAFEGPMKGKRLPMVSFLLTTWEEWRRLHPDTLALVPDPAHQQGYRMMEQQHARGGLRGFRPPETWGKKLRDDSRLPDWEQILGIAAGNAHKAYPIDSIRRMSVINDRVGPTPVLLVHTAASDMVTAFSRSIRGRPLTFERIKASPNLIDKDTRSTWTAYGECTSGPLKGTKLERITPTPSFWFGWAQFFPDTEVFR
jgi:hypothetical protein